ncbi:hypothetical protein FGB62_409g03 [Gracilaria domingensis]|nr:hypothetical protein FGB62_409g03 [Gracilaria domingensis]
MGTNFEPLRLYMERRLGTRVDAVSVAQLLDRFSKHGRTLLRDSCVDNSGHIPIHTTAGSHITSENVLEALQMRKEDKQSGKRGGGLKDSGNDKAAYKETAADIRRLIKLGPAREAKRCRLMATRRLRSEFRKARASFARASQVSIEAWVGESGGVVQFLKF